MNAAAYLLPAVCVAIVLIAAIRRVRVYDSFAKGAAGALELVRSLFPYIAASLILSELFEASGLSSAFAQALAPLFSALGIPSEIAPLVLVKPFSGSGSLAVLSEICAKFGADSYVARCACVVYASGETVFYLSALYFAGQKQGVALPLALATAANLCAAILGCLFCRIV